MEENSLKRQDYVENNFKNVMTSKRFHICNVQMYPIRRNMFCDVIMHTVYNTFNRSNASNDNFSKFNRSLFVGDELNVTFD